MTKKVFVLRQQEQLLQRFLVQCRTDHAQTAGVVGRTFPDLKLLGGQIEVEPSGPILAGNHSLGPEDIAIVLAHGQNGQSLLELLPTVLPGGLAAPGGEYLIGIVVVVLVAAAGAAVVHLVVLMMMVMLVVVAVVMLMMVLVVVAVVMLMMVLVAVIVLMLMVALMVVTVLMLMVVLMVVTVLMPVMMVLDFLHQFMG